MKNILFVATVTKHINAFHIPYLKWFKEQGYEIHVASKGNEKIEYCDKHFNLPFERFPLKANNIKAYKELKKIINENNYDIIHCHTPVGGVLTRLAARKARKNDTKVLYTAHGFHFYKGAPLLNWIIYYPIEKVMAHYTDCLITIVNEDYKFAKKHLKAKEIKHINGIGVNTDRFSKEITEEQKENLRKDLNIKKEDIVLCYVAELNKNKNQILLIEAVEKLKNKNIRLLLVGNGNYMEKYKDEVQKRGLQYNVIFLGRREDIASILSITDIYLASSIREGLGLNVIEAMYMELPIVATNNRGHRELVMNKETGILLKENTFDEMAKAINEVMNFSEEEKETIVENAKDNIQKYMIENVLQEMKKIYMEFMKNEN